MVQRRRVSNFSLSPHRPPPLPLPAVRSCPTRSWEEGCNLMCPGSARTPPSGLRGRCEGTESSKCDKEARGGEGGSHPSSPTSSCGAPHVCTYIVTTPPTRRSPARSPAGFVVRPAAREKTEPRILDLFSLVEIFCFGGLQNIECTWPMNKTVLPVELSRE